jgi:hypothetical protein
VNVDSIFLKGASHKNCEDYTLAEKTNLDEGYLIVADGCSSGRRSDVASRVMATLAERVLLDDWGLLAKLGPMTAADTFLRHLGQYYANVLGLRRLYEPTDLLSTLLVAVVRPQETKVFMYGDGAVMLRYRDGSAKVLTVSYEGSAPCYPAYSLEGDALQGAYAKERGSQRVELRTSFFSGIEDGAGPRCAPSVQVVAANSEYVRVGLPFSLDTHELAAITLSSDGLASFAPEADAVALGLRSLGYKTLRGEFLRRRVRAMVEELEAEGVRPQDDLGFAAAVFPDEPSSVPPLVRPVTEGRAAV